MGKQRTFVPIYPWRPSGEIHGQELRRQENWLVAYGDLRLMPKAERVVSVSASGVETTQVRPSVLEFNDAQSIEPNTAYDTQPYIEPPRILRNGEIIAAPWILEGTVYLSSSCAVNDTFYLFGVDNWYDGIYTAAAVGLTVAKNSDGEFVVTFASGRLAGGASAITPTLEADTRITLTIIYDFPPLKPWRQRLYRSNPTPGGAPVLLEDRTDSNVEVLPEKWVPFAMGQDTVSTPPLDNLIGEIYEYRMWRNLGDGAGIPWQQWGLKTVYPGEAPSQLYVYMTLQQDSYDSDDDLLLSEPLATTNPISVVADDDSVTVAPNTILRASGASPYGKNVTQEFWFRYEGPGTGPAATQVALGSYFENDGSTPAFAVWWEIWINASDELELRFVCDVHDTDTRVIRDLSSISHGSFVHVSVAVGHDANGVFVRALVFVAGTDTDIGDVSLFTEATHLGPEWVPGSRYDSQNQDLQVTLTDGYVSTDDMAIAEWRLWARMRGTTETSDDRASRLRLGDREGLIAVHPFRAPSTEYQGCTVKHVTASGTPSAEDDAASPLAALTISDEAVVMPTLAVENAAGTQVTSPSWVAAIVQYDYGTDQVRGAYAHPYGDTQDVQVLRPASTTGVGDWFNPDDRSDTELHLLINEPDPDSNTYMSVVQPGGTRATFTLGGTPAPASGQITIDYRYRYNGLTDGELIIILGGVTVASVVGLTGGSGGWLRGQATVNTSVLSSPDWAALPLAIEASGAEGDYELAPVEYKDRQDWGFPAAAGWGGQETNVLAVQFKEEEFFGVIATERLDPGTRVELNFRVQDVGEPPAWDSGATTSWRAKVHAIAAQEGMEIRVFTRNGSDGTAIEGPGVPFQDMVTDDVPALTFHTFQGPVWTQAQFDSVQDWADLVVCVQIQVNADTVTTSPLVYNTYNAETLRGRIGAYSDDPDSSDGNDYVPSISSTTLPGGILSDNGIISRLQSSSKLYLNVFPGAGRPSPSSDYTYFPRYHSGLDLWIPDGIRAYGPRGAFPGNYVRGVLDALKVRATFADVSNAGACTPFLELWAWRGESNGPAGDEIYTDGEETDPSPTTTPAAPSNFNASDDEYQDGVLCTWDPVPFATSYRIYRWPADEPNPTTATDGVGTGNAERVIDVPAGNPAFFIDRTLYPAVASTRQYAVTAVKSTATTPEGVGSTVNTGRAGGSTDFGSLGNVGKRVAGAITDPTDDPQPSFLVQRTVGLGNGTVELDIPSAKLDQLTETDWDNLYIRVGIRCDDDTDGYVVQASVDDIQIEAAEGLVAGVDQMLLTGPGQARFDFDWVQVQTPLPSGTGDAVVGDAEDRFIGNFSKIYRLAPGETTAADVSKSGGYGTSETPGEWQFCSYGDNYVIATNYGDEIQAFIRTGTPLAWPSTFVDLIPNGFESDGTPTASPSGDDLNATKVKARFVAPVRNFLVAADIRNAGYGPHWIWWSDVENPRFWNIRNSAGHTLEQSALSDALPVYQTPGAITGLVGGDNGLIFKRRAVHALLYTGTLDVFRVETISTSTGCQLPGSIVQADGRTYWWDGGSFQMMDGLSRPVEIGSKVVSRFLNDVSSSTHALAQRVTEPYEVEAQRMSGAYDPQTGVIAWLYGSNDHARWQNQRLLLYNVREDRWGFILDQDLEGSLLVNRSNPDSGAAISLRGIEGAFTAPASIGWFRFSGETFYEAVLETKAFQLDPNRVVEITGVMPVFSAGGALDRTSTVWPPLKITVFAADDPRFSYNVRTPESVEREKASESQVYPFHIGGRWFRVQLLIPEQAENLVQGFEGFYVEYTVRGQR